MIQRDLRGMNQVELHQHLNLVRLEMHRIDGLKGNVDDIDWASIDQLAIELGRVVDAIDLIGTITLAEATAARRWRN